MVSTYNAQTNTISINAPENETIYFLEKGQNLIKVSSVPEEYIYIGERYPGYETLEQKLIKMNVGEQIIPVDLIRVNTLSGERIFYFDVSEIFRQQYKSSHISSSTDYDKIYNYWCCQAAKYLQSIYPNKHVPKPMIDDLFVQAIRTYSDDNIIKNSIGSETSEIPKEESDKGVREFIEMLKSPQKSESDKALIQEFMIKTKLLFENILKESNEHNQTQNAIRQHETIKKDTYAKYEPESKFQFIGVIFIVILIAMLYLSAWK